MVHLKRKNGLIYAYQGNDQICHYVTVNERIVYNTDPVETPKRIFLQDFSWAS